MPPPHGRPSTASLRVIPAASRRPSSSASDGSSYVFSRVPPMAGPRRVEWMQTNIHAPVASSCRTTTCSPSHRRSRSSNTSSTLTRPRTRGEAWRSPRRVRRRVSQARGGRTRGPASRTPRPARRRRDARSAAVRTSLPPGAGTRRRTFPRSARPESRPAHGLAAARRARGAPRPSPAARSALRSRRAAAERRSPSARAPDQVQASHDLGVADHEAEPPAGHAVALREREHLDADLACARPRRGSSRAGDRRRRGRHRRSRGRSPLPSRARTRSPLRTLRAGPRRRRGSPGS